MSGSQQKTARKNGEVIFVDDEKHVRLSVQQTLQLADYDTRCFASAEPALRHLTPDWPGIVVTDVKLPRMDGLELLRRIVAVDPDIPVVLVTAHGGIPMAVQAMKDGAYDFLEKPFSSDLLLDTVRRSIEKRLLVLENRGFRLDIARREQPDSPILGNSPTIERLRQIIANVAESDADVLITGETGVGKELVAQSLHNLSRRHKNRFVPVNCGAIPETIIESELFGHEPGTFTGARELRIGKFEFADGGTLLLDEIESMPVHLQVRLLRAIEERIIERLGSNRRIPIDVRILAATKIDIQQACEKGDFRKDLFYRLNVVSIDVPPLRERRDDIPMLFNHFLYAAATEYHRPVPLISHTLMQNIMKNEWPGNVRELRNAAERYLLESTDKSAGELKSRQPSTPQPNETVSLRNQVHIFEKAVLDQTLNRHKGNIKSVCHALHLPRKTLYDKMARHGLSRQQYT